MVTRGRVNGSRTGELVWAGREGAFTNLGGDDAAKTVERLVSAAGGVGFLYWDAEVCSGSVLPAEGEPAADADKVGTGNVESEGVDILEAATVGDEEFVFKDKAEDISLGGAGISC